MDETRVPPWQGAARCAGDHLHPDPMQQTELESLLEELRRTQDHRPPPAPASAPASAPADPDPVFPIPTQDQLASLLSSLTAPQQPQLPPPQPQPRDLTALSFPESLPILQHLGADPDFLEALAQIKSDQADEEMRMRDERNRLEGEGKRGGLRCVRRAGVACVVFWALTDSLHGILGEASMCRRRG